jgi:hypothetical protein
MPDNESSNEDVHLQPGLVSAGSDVFILGAGFSKQISNEMPLLKELSKAVALRLPETKAIDPIPFIEADVEMAMTFLAQPQPWKTEAQRLRNRALFLELTEAMASEIEQRSASVRACPGWLLRFVHWLHFRRAAVITLNYDTLLESAIQAIPGGPDCYARNMIPFRFAAEQGGVGGDVRADSLELLKLHGSTNWRYSGRDSYSGELIQWSAIRRWRNPVAVGDRERVEESFPLLIPPVTEKTGYFAHHCIRHLWKRASHVLGAAKRIYCLGHSLPTTDLTFRFLLSDLPAAEPVDFYLVNRPVELGHFREILPEARFRLHDRFLGSEPIPPFVDALFTHEFFPDLNFTESHSCGRVEAAIRQRVPVGKEIQAALGAGTCSVGDLRPNSVTLLIEDSSVPVEGRPEIPIRIPWKSLEGVFSDLLNARQQRMDLERCDECARTYYRRLLGPWVAALLEASGMATVWFCINRWVVSPAGSNTQEIAQWRSTAQA